MQYQNKHISIVVVSNKKDYFFTKICIASIRYFYPDVEILLIKDKLNGNYSTKRLRRVYNVSLLHFDKKYFGWGASKIHFILRKDMPEKRYLVLDSDIIFVGKVLEQIEKMKGDFVVVPEALQSPFSTETKNTYIDPERATKYFFDYEYPGYFFNSGQMIVTPGKISKELISSCFDPDNYPYYKKVEDFPTVDQSILNCVLPVLAKRGKIKIDQVPFMRWSVIYFDSTGNDDVLSYLKGEKKLMIHYCGDKRTYKLSQMKGKNLLNFFKNEYLKHLPGFYKKLDIFQNIINSLGRVLQFHQNLNTKRFKIFRYFSRLRKNFTF